MYMYSLVCLRLERKYITDGHKKANTTSKNVPRSLISIDKLITKKKQVEI